MKKSILTAIALTALASASFAASTPSTTPAAAAKPSTTAATPMDPAKIPAALKNPQFAGSVEVLKTFPGPSGLTGWVVKEVAGGKQVVLFSTADQNTVIAGMLMDKDGNNLSAAYGEQHIEKPDYAAVLKDVTASGAFAVEGSAKAKAEITVFYDVNCGFCKLLHKIVAPAVDAGDLRVRYLPVAILGADSAPKGAALLGSKDVAKAMSAAVSGTADQSTDKALLAKVASNTALMKKHGFNGTPAVLYTTSNGGNHAVVVSNGLPTVSEMFKSLGIDGKLDKLKADPQLARYIR